ncbi:MAG TPA: Rieske 2Fe-2S domain-containing protein [Caulobacteraceae bacterium]|nr:Rieske 2Fe-2S domain-containing protein [Caulobacteraceae bacterium]
MLKPQDNDLLCRVEGDAPMGGIMRGVWLPACMSEEVAEADGAPVKSRLVGEDLVVFRDTRGALGVLDEHCPHRGASLALGRNEACGLRCLYHGWKFDVQGAVVDMASEPATSPLRQNLRHRAYPVREAGGFVWVWLGDPEAIAPFEAPAWAPTPTTNISIVKMHAACNWAQVLEGSIDSAHSSSLHSTNMPAARVTGSTAREGAWLRPSDDKAPRLEIEQTAFGFHYAALRRPLVAPERFNYVRTTLFIAPFTVLIPPNDRYKLAQMLVPIDDVNTMFYWIAWHETGGIGQDEWRAFCHATPGVDLDENWRKRRNADNRYGQDRAAMQRGDFTGIQGIPAQDMAMWESMGPIADRTREHLGSSDLAILQFRRQMIEAARRFQDKGLPFAAGQDRPALVDLASFEGLAPKAADWRTLVSATIADKMPAL